MNRKTTSKERFKQRKLTSTCSSKEREKGGCFVHDNVMTYTRGEPVTKNEEEKGGRLNLLGVACVLL